MGTRQDVLAKQVEQAQEALRVLYQECLPLPWARALALSSPRHGGGQGRVAGKILSRRGQHMETSIYG
jgi:hypothetical protein